MHMRNDLLFKSAIMQKRRRRLYRVLSVLLERLGA
ncbi:hypothetical protein PI125_g24194 [Phytophthora idaei]|nr:hypothetical protein PI125_g24194 [Phytophthora idaei]